MANAVAGRKPTEPPIKVHRHHIAIDILDNNGGGPRSGLISAVAADVWRRQFERWSKPLSCDGGIPAGYACQKMGTYCQRSVIRVVQPIANLGISNSLQLSILGWAETLLRKLLWME